MLSYTDLRKGTIFVMNGDPYEVLEAHFLRMQQRKAVVQTTIRNLVSGKVLERNFQPSEAFEEAEIEKKAAMFIFKKPGRPPSGADEYWFSWADEGNLPRSLEATGTPAKGLGAKNRFMLQGEVIGEGVQFLKPQTKVGTVVFNEKVIKVSLPVKMDFEVLEAPPAIKGNTAQGGTKVATIAGGAKISVPLFINTGDVVRINTETGEYVERAEKSSLSARQPR